MHEDITHGERRMYRNKIKNLLEAIVQRKYTENKYDASITTELYLKNISQHRLDIEKEYGSSIEMLRYLNNLNKIEQPGSLNQIYLYQYDKSKKYKFTKLINNIYLILNEFFGTFYGFISKPIYLFTQNKLTIYINYYIPN